MIFLYRSRKYIGGRRMFAGTSYAFVNIVKLGAAPVGGTPPTRNLMGVGL